MRFSRIWSGREGRYFVPYCFSRWVYFRICGQTLPTNDEIIFNKLPLGQKAGVLSVGSFSVVSLNVVGVVLSQFYLAGIFPPFGRSPL